MGWLRGPTYPVNDLMNVSQDDHLHVSMLRFRCGLKRPIEESAKWATIRSPPINSSVNSVAFILENILGTRIY